jgi:hypothetical protein
VHGTQAEVIFVSTWAVVLQCLGADGGCGICGAGAVERLFERLALRGFFVHIVILIICGPPRGALSTGTIYAQDRTVRFCVYHLSIYPICTPWFFNPTYSVCVTAVWLGLAHDTLIAGAGLRRAV